MFSLGEMLFFSLTNWRICKISAKICILLDFEFYLIYNIYNIGEITRKADQVIKGRDHMGLFDNLKSNSAKPVEPAASPLGTRTESFEFTSLPESLAEMQALPEADLATPFKTAALTVCALCAYAADRTIGTEMLNWLRGPRPLSGQDISFLDDRFRCGRTYVPFSYFAGALPENSYAPSQPFTVRISSDHNSGAEQGYMKLFIPSGGADTPRTIKLRMNGDGKWFLWEQHLLPDIRQPSSADRWV